jgi:hypothetical protein
MWAASMRITITAVINLFLALPIFALKEVFLRGNE